MKVVNDLLGYKNLKIVQDTDYFSFSLDSVLLPNFVTISRNTKNILDIGTGNAPIPMILNYKYNIPIVAFEIQKEIYELACETLKLNNLSEKIRIVNDDIKNISKYYDYESFDVIVSNPPYFKNQNLSKKNDNLIKAIARHELKLNLDDIIRIAYKYLKNDGVLSMVYRTERLTDVLTLMRQNKIEPKRILFIYPKEGKKSNLFLIEGIKNGNYGIKEVQKLIVHDQDGNYTADVIKYFS